MLTIEKFLLLVVLPVVVGCSLLEAFILSRRQAYDWKAMGVSLLDLLGRNLLAIFLPLSIATPLTLLALEHKLMTIDVNTWQALLALFVGQEFCYYCYHRAAHRVRFFWCNHAVHHSPNQLNLSAAYRIGLLGKLSGTALFFAPLVWLGFAPRIVALTLTINLLYQFWIHATWIPKLGWLELIFNTPSAHRVHHAANLEYLDANYGGVLIIFDRLFGTYKAERADLPCRYGLVKPMTSYNPLRIEFAQWLILKRDLVGARSLRSVVGYMCMPPGWSADGRGETTEALRKQQLAESEAAAAAPGAVVAKPEASNDGVLTSESNLQLDCR